ncbi:MAG: response regulator [Chloroflexota bacterium]
MRILIADDESIIRMGLQAMLREMGHEVFAARNGREALQMARSHRPDMAILDIKMPYTDGLQAAKTLGHTQPMPILLLTAYSEQDLIEKATDLPIHGYLIKPIEPAAMAAAIAVAQKRFAETQALAQQAEKLAQTLAMRKLVERAKGKLMESGLSEEEAYRAMQEYARAQQRPLMEVAQKVLQCDDLAFLR